MGGSGGCRRIVMMALFYPGNLAGVVIIER